MSKTLLAVDDSATIRKALEITFGGEGYRVLAADNRAAALARLADKPDIVLIDTVLGSDDGYALCREVRAQAPSAAIVLLSSRFNPYDTGRGQAAGADEYCDKPFDTQQLLDKARTVLEAKAAQLVAQPAAASPYRAPAEPQAQFRGPTPTPANAIPAVQSPREESRPPSQPAARAQTLVFGSSPVNAQTANPYATGVATPPSAPPAAPAAAAKPAGPPPVPTRQPAEPPRPAPVAASAPPPMPVQAPRPAAPVAAAPSAPPAPPAPAAAAPAVQTAVATQLAPKLGALGLSKEQADAVLALSREVVERVVWEVVPQLAEVMIREEIQRLTKE